MVEMDIEKIKKAGEITRDTVAFARIFVKPGMKLVDIANTIEDKIVELGGRPAFAVTLCIDEVAAHATPAWNSEDEAKGLLKVDLGVHVDGWCADTAFSLDLEDSEENKKLIKSAEDSLGVALDAVSKDISLGEIGKLIGDKITESGFSPIINLSGHSIERWNLHAGLTIPNVDNKSDFYLDDGLYAIEPFTTNGLGRVRDGGPSGIFHLEREGNVRDGFAREVLKFIKEEYETLPFCSRWIYKKFGSRGLLALRQIKGAGLLHEYAQLIEAGNGKVAQAEHSFILGKEKLIVTK